MDEHHVAAYICHKEYLYGLRKVIVAKILQYKTQTSKRNMNIYDLLKAEQSLIGKRSLFSDVEQLTSLYHKRACPLVLHVYQRKRNQTRCLRYRELELIRQAS